MPITDQLRTLARHEYVVVRSALTVLDRRVVAPYFGEGPSATVARLRDSLDDLAHHLLGDRPAGDAGRGDLADEPTPFEQTPAPAADSTDDAAADSTDDAAADSTDDAAADAPAEPGEGSAVLSAEEVAEADVLAEEYLQAEDDHLTGELAENEELRRVQAELRAKHTLQENDERH